MVRRALFKDGRKVFKDGRAVFFDDEDPMGIGCCCNSCPAYATDDFNRADNTNIDTGSTAGWTESSGAWAIASNTLQCTTAGIALCDTTHPDGDFTMTVEADFSHTNSGSSCELIVACHDTSEFYAARFVVGGTPSISIRTGAGGTLKTLTTGLTIATNTTYRGKVCVTPEGHITAYIDGVAKLTALYADMSFGTRTKCGLRGIGTGTATFDNFSVAKARNTDASTCPECEIAPGVFTSCEGLSPPASPCTSISTPAAITLPANGAEEWTETIITIGGVGHLSTLPAHVTPARSPLCCLRIDGAYELGVQRDISGNYTPCRRRFDFDVAPYDDPDPNKTCYRGSDTWAQWIHKDGSDYYFLAVLTVLDSAHFWLSPVLTITGSKLMTKGSYTLTYVCSWLNGAPARCSWPTTITLDVS